MQNQLIAFQVNSFSAEGKDKFPNLTNESQIETLFKTNKTQSVDYMQYTQMA